MLALRLILLLATFCLAKTAVTFPDQQQLTHRTKPLIDLTIDDLLAFSFDNQEVQEATQFGDNIYTTDFAQLSTITSCSEQSIFVPSELSISPDPPKRNAKLTFTIKGVMAKEIVQGAYADVQVKLGLIQLIHNRFDLCKELENLGESCPIPSGPFTLEKTVRVHIRELIEG